MTSQIFHRGDEVFYINNNGHKVYAKVTEVSAERIWGWWGKSLPKAKAKAEYNYHFIANNRKGLNIPIGRVNTIKK